MTDPNQNAPLESLLAPAYDEARLAEAWQRISDTRAARRAEAREQREARSRRVFARVFVFGVPACAAMVLWFALGSERRRAEPHVAEPGALGVVTPGTTVAPGAGLIATAATTIAFDDGSRLALDAGARMQVLTNDGTRFTTVLDRGRVTFDVRRGGARRWEIETSIATIEVLGTKFVVAHHGARLQINVERGVVMVRGERIAGRVQRLTDGQQLVVTAAPETAADASGSHGERAAPETAPAERALPKPPRMESSRAVAVTKRSAIAHAIDTADRLRAHDPREAARLLERAIADHPSDASSGLAAFALGRLYLEVLDRPARASQLFRRIVVRGTPHTLLEDAHARLVEALLASGDRAGARDALADYERTYPRASRAAALRERVGP